MNVDAFEQFFSLLSLALLAGTLVVLVARLAYSKVAPATALIDGFRPLSRPLAAAVTTTCTLGSLYFSEIANFVPCRLCWYQRAAMYPLAAILIWFTVRRSERIAFVTVPIAAIGGSISMYHWLYERWPSLNTGVCSATVPCNVPWFETFGFVTLAFMAFTGFFATIVFTTLPPKSSSRTGAAQ
jgi:disulfide bond formation protein DsbB